MRLRLRGRLRDTTYLKGCVHAERRDLGRVRRRVRLRLRGRGRGRLRDKVCAC